MILDDFTSDYETLLEKGNNSTTNLKRMKILATKIFKTIYNLNPSLMKDIFTSKINPKVRTNNLIFKGKNTIKYGTKSLIALGPQIWNTRKH